MNFSITIIAACVLLALTDVAPASCGSNRRREPPRNLNPTAAATPTPASNEGKEMKVLAQGQYGKVAEPFLVVAREAEVYGELRALVAGLPELGADFFEKHAVVAAFAGTRRSGGFGIEFEDGKGGLIDVTVTPPPKDAMVTMALTQPFKVVSVPVGEEEGVDFELHGPWALPIFRPYRVASGEFTTGGGFAGRFEKLALTGLLNITRHGKLVTLLFHLDGTGGEKKRALRVAATGLERAADRFEIPRVDAGTLVDHPRPPLRVTGRFAGDGAKLSLTFDSLPTNVNDGFDGMGNLEATATGPAPPKSKPQSEM